MTSVNDNSYRTFATPGLASSLNSKNYFALLFSERAIEDEILLSHQISVVQYETQQENHPV